jgi:hypothetical protein
VLGFLEIVGRFWKRWQWSKYPYYFNLVVGKIFLQIICDECKQIILEKEGNENLSHEKFPITDEEALEINKNHRGHECHIEAVEKLSDI